ncbi:Gfo/Idh/MocA family protein [Aquimarina brevivitae]|uniref:Putative dehydrogenase n=1 Tax=Aquimarina brevivitae TaxID=323412 RepID=A0A4Q7NU17_9FLAO|nr:Gfo/Idh/MocA family oxidoreductase [Aquimarina brevivitae]RZS90671.1 putative dehydrogenase [Aquimarina brevivitae]
MKNSKIINWGILGCGKIAHKFAADLKHVPNTTLHAVASRTTENASQFAKTYSATTYYNDYQDLAADPKIDVIYIATPHVFHKEHALLCLKHKKAVLCEKPFAMHTEQVKEMISTASENQVFLMEALWTYFLPHYQYVLQLVKDKTLGEVKSLTADFGFKATFDPNGRLFNKALGGGSILDVGIYPIFAALTLLGAPDHIKANAVFGPTGVDEECTMLFTYASNQKASLYASITKQTTTEAIIAFEKGKIIINSRFHEPTDVSIITENNTITKTFDYTTNGYNYEAQHVSEMLRKGGMESNIMTFERSLELISILDEVRQCIDLNYTSKA